MAHNPFNVQPRNTFVLVRLFLKSEEQVGNIVVPTGEHEYCEAEVLAVGPAPVQAAGGVSDTFDLEPGARVLVKHKKKIQRPSQVGDRPITAYMDEGLRLQHQDDADGDVYLFDQFNILAVLPRA